MHDKTDPNPLARVLESLWEEATQSVATLRAARDASGIERVIVFLKRYARALQRSDRPREATLAIATMLRRVNEAFVLEDVGVLGADLVEPLLRHEDEEVQIAALECLASWARDDNHLVDVICDAKRHVSVAASKRIDELLLALGRSANPWDEVKNRPAGVVVAALLPAAALPSFLKRNLGLEVACAIDLIESAKMRSPWLRASDVCFDFSEPGTLRVWCDRWSLSLRRVELDDLDRWEISLRLSSGEAYVKLVR